MKAFVIAVSEGAARELCAGARSMADSVALCMVGAPAIAGVADVCLHIDVPADRIADDAYPSVKDAFDAQGADLALAEAAIVPTALAGRLAAALGTAAISGVTSLEGDVAESMYFGGAGVRKAKAAGTPVYVVGAGVFDGSAATGTDVVEEVAFQAPSAAVVKTGEEALPKSDVNLAAADAVVACGRGFAAEEDLQLARDLAGKLGAEVGCSRPLAEGMDWFPKEAYIGVSGAVVAPKTYVALGISGQTQHMVGCNGSETIIAINKDKNAPVFSQCDIGLVADLKTALPALVAAL